MARKDTTNAASKGGKVEFKGFYNPVLNADIKTAVKALTHSESAFCDRLFEMVDAGLKVSFTTDTARTHFNVSVFDQRPKSDSAGYVFSIKHADIQLAVGLAWLLVFEIHEGKGWGRFLNDEADYDW